MAYRVRADALRDPRPLRQATDDPGGVVAVQPFTVVVQEKGSGVSVLEGHRDGCNCAHNKRDRSPLAALARDPEHLVPTLVVQVVNVG